MTKFSTIMHNLNKGYVYNIPVEFLEISTEVRDKNEDFVSELGGFAEEFGILENILVVADEANEKFIVREGNQRVNAAIVLGIKEVPAKLLATDKVNTALLVNKVVQLSHSTMELALLYKKAIEEGASQNDLVERFNVHKSKVSELVKIAQLPENIQEAAKNDPKKFNHITLLKLAKITSADEQQAEFERILNGDKKKEIRFSSFMKQLEADKLLKKKLTAEDVNSLFGVLSTILQVLADSKYRIDPDSKIHTNDNEIERILGALHALRVITPDRGNTDERENEVVCVEIIPVDDDQIISNECDKPSEVEAA